MYDADIVLLQISNNKRTSVNMNVHFTSIVLKVLHELGEVLIFFNLLYLYL